MRRIYSSPSTKKKECIICFYMINVKTDYFIRCSCGQNNCYICEKCAENEEIYEEDDNWCFCSRSPSMIKYDIYDDSPAIITDLLISHQISSSLFQHDKDQNQFQILLQLINDSCLATNLAVPMLIKKEIAEYSTGDIYVHDVCGEDVLVL